MVNILMAEGDIFASKAHVLVNPVNTKGIMGAGLAAQFKKNFPEMNEEYKKACENGDLIIGRIHIWKHLIEADYPWYSISSIYDDYTTGYVVNLPTKDHWKDPSRLEYIQIGMQLLVDFVNRTPGIKTIAIPALGSGLGGLDWHKVEQTIKFYAEGIDREVTVYVYPPQ